MKLVTNILENIGQVEWFPIAGLVIFFLFFMAILVRVLRMKKEVVESISRLPLEDDENQQIDLNMPR